MPAEAVTQEQEQQGEYSGLFEGRSIFERLNRSSFGAFYHALARVQDPCIRWEDFQLPKVVVVGSESAGKSSLLESITKCAVFPRDARTCTRCPVVLRLVNHPSGDSSTSVRFRGKEWTLQGPDEILARAKAVMEEIGDRIVADELTIEIRQPNIPTFTFVDLPGIRAYPPDAKQQTERLARTYLREAGCLVICVASATVPRLNSLQGIAMVLEEHKEKDTVLALTMADKVREQDFGEQVVGRLLGRTDDCEGHFRDVVAVINRDSSDRVSLATNDDAEARAFNALLVAHTSDPAGPARLRADAHEASLRMTVGRLVEKVDCMYHDYICRNWKARALEQVQKLIAANAGQAAQLGADPAGLSAQAVRDAVLRELRRGPEPFADAALPTADVADVQPPTRAQQPTLWADSSHAASRALAWAERMHATSQAFAQWAAGVATGADTRARAQRCLAAAFTDALPLRLQRLRACREAMCQRLDAEIARIGALEQPRIVAAAERLLDAGYGGAGASQVFEAARAQSAVLARVLADVVWPAMLKAVAGEEVPLAECPEVAEKRAALRRKDEALREALKVISNIESALAGNEDK
eukprot:m51a1_g14440 hypothetical protein (586) ;mRNA; r:561600-563511